MTSLIFWAVDNKGERERERQRETERETEREREYAQNKSDRESLQFKFLLEFSDKKFLLSVVL